MGASKTFLLLPHRIPASEELLALTTTAPLFPLSSSIAPTESLSLHIPSINSPSTILTTVDAPGALTLEVSNAISFSINLEPVLNFSTSRGNRVKYTIKSREIKTSWLKNPGAIFAQLIEKPSFKQQLMKMLPRKAYLDGHRAFFITGIVTAIDATIEKVIESEHGFNAKAKAPLDVVTGIPLPLDTGIGGGVDIKSGNDSKTVSQAVGNDIWGAEYMEIRRDWWNAEVLKLDRPVEKIKGGKFFRDKPADESESDEDGG
jgi:hypothetical protein